MEEEKIYDEKTGELLEGPFDYSKGEVREGTRFVAHHEEQEEVSHKEIMPGTEHMNGGNGLYTIVIDQPAKEAWDEYEPCLVWHEFTENELATNNVSELVSQIVDEKITSAIATAVALSKGS